MEEHQSESEAALQSSSMLDERIAPYDSASRALACSTTRQRRNFSLGVFPVVALEERQSESAVARQCSSMLGDIVAPHELTSRSCPGQ
jgi:hypothetical protein